MPTKEILDGLVTDQIEADAWEIAKAIQAGSALSDDATSDLHVLLIEFAKEMQRNAIYLCIGEVRKALGKGFAG